jgi:hypothetical protein
MQRRVLALGLILLSSACPAFAQGILPASFAGWTATSRAGFSPASSKALAGGQSEQAYLAAAAANEYGFVSGEQAAYARGASNIEVMLYRMKDPSGAYGEYSYLRTADMEHANLTDHSSVSAQRALILVGTLVMDVSGLSLINTDGTNTDLVKLQPDMQVLIGAITPHAQQGPLPTLWQDLPQKDMVDRSDRYVLGPQTLNELFPGKLGDSLDFQNGTEAELAHYNLQGHDAELLLADFPTPQIALSKLAQLQKRFNVNGSNSAPGSPLFFAKRQLTTLAIVTGVATQAEANSLLGQLRSGTVLTWNEPSFEATEPSIEMMIVGSIEGAGLLCLFAMVAGVAFGGFRLVIKRLLPDKVFDRSSHLQVLQLGLASKPINADDFYGASSALAHENTADRKRPDRVALRIFNR